MARLPVVGPKSLPGDKRRRLALDELYAELPTIACQGKCAESCGPVPMARLEWQRVCRAGGERKGGPDLTCPYLEEERCSVYAVRPTLCRLWGVVDAMPCPWGCEPERMLTRAEGNEFLRRAAEISS
jgi:hypothetical protein